MAVLSISRGAKVFVFYGSKKLPFLFYSWFFANLISSVLAGKSVALILISIFTVILTALTLRSVIDFFITYPQKALDALVFFSLGRIIGILIQPRPYTEALPWKFGYGEWVILLSLLFVARTKNIKLLWISCPILIFVSLANEARTLSLLVIGALFISLFGSGKRMGAGFLLSIVAVTFFMYYAYLDVALGGHLGPSEITRARVLAESDLGPLAARKEFIFSTRAFADSPILGYGFDPIVKSEIIQAGADDLSRKGIKVEYSYLSELPVHSFLMSSLVVGGIFGGLYWVFVILLSVQALLLTAEMSRYQKPLVAYLSFTLLDRVLFSPYGAVERLNAAFFVGYILLVNRSRSFNE